MTVLNELSNAMAAAVENVGASLVRVEGRKRMSATGVVWNSDGVIVTASHVVTRDEELHIGLPNGETVSATLVGRDPTTDVAVLRSNAKNLSVPNWTGGDSLKVGHLVLALGRPGQNVLATLGVISSIAEEWHTPAGGKIDYYLQTDVTMYPGFSGGPLVGVGGEIYGINSSTLLRGVSVTIPTTTIAPIVDTLLKHGKLRRGYLGVGSQPVRLPATLEQQLGQETGLLLVAVEPNSPAEKGGLMLGDVIVALDGHPVRVPDELLAGLTGDKVGKDAKIKLVRGGQIHEVTVTVGERQ
ncbi:MAG: serine protease [Chloroflexota bacterium]|nr:PDZ domain-containing protein [Chloroflexota bacterium]NOG66191.1 PDZ domain-containing protein [Chloroflexota bacterium]GIK67677.1 MAG: serine protease [Chloroflexota bacterium]